LFIEIIGAAKIVRSYELLELGKRQEALGRRH